MRPGAKTTFVVLGLVLLAAAVIFAIPLLTGRNATTQTSPTPSQSPSASPSGSAEPQWPVDTPTGSGTSTPTSSPVDRRPPAAVTGLRLEGNTQDSFTVAWNANAPVDQVAYYVVLRNGYQVAAPSSPSATMQFLADGSHVLVQVAAFDASGNQSEWRAIVIVPPPTAKPSAPVSSRTPQPTRTSASTSPSAAPTSPATSPSQSPSPSQASGTPTASASASSGVTIPVVTATPAASSSP